DPNLEPLVDAGPACQEQRWFSDSDGDGHGNLAETATACERPAGWVALGDDNCPQVYNPDQIDSDGDGAGDACDAIAPSCHDFGEPGTGIAHRGVADDGAATSVYQLDARDAVYGSAAFRVVTLSGASAGLRIEIQNGVTFDVSSASHLLLAVRGHNSNTPSWQGNGPVLVIEDASGRRRELLPLQRDLLGDGFNWSRLRAPVSGGGDWLARGDTPDLGRLRAIEVRADTWGAGFAIDVDGVVFGDAGSDCAYHCPTNCSGRGQCDAASLTCQCQLGAAGALCQECAPGFVLVGDRCQLPADGDYDSWPNPVSAANSDPWLAVHHAKLRLLRPRVLVLNFGNDSTPEGAASLTDAVIAGFREASRSQLGGGPAQLEYALARGIVDLRDGVLGRPAAPAGWPYLNSTLMPRTTRAGSGERIFDYAALFSDTFAGYYGFDDPAQPGRRLPLCELIERGLVHEVWVITAGDDNDSGMAEVLESKQRYDAAGNRISGSFDTCAGNGCFDPGVPLCQRSVRIGSINYHRGPGCYLHSHSHGVEFTGARGVVPQLSEWFVPFARFDLERRYDLPVPNLYYLRCTDPNNDGILDPPCLEYPALGTAWLHHGNGNVIQVQPWDPACGNVHFPPNATWHYDYDNPNQALSSCDDFGRGHGTAGADALSLVSGANWSYLEQQTPDCGGGFLIWWYRHMPGYGSGQTFVDGRQMPSVWPFMFY
ncbi:MAG: hypothetical protein JXR83_01685, partial [Deltaproteobacteria bacterium]|nr:hypothetical protein [Deltaproteobacteria bacterium]